ncbi:translesion DNA synthesis-associated protein ImuA [Thalassotalea ponticola]|uniref:translesion DNA synthesis-associated protein ImuA n=1 Tax=Thalassotalea ponticola TaxID=1523392 RepID=UPI0025B439B9|nr:translesion DNA synthesis-associated protein ImuA [Thalassotalea ponticola]MDN3651185.1 translesion DNA synthesis-associated protein ImuA [Thalassotalea ponticola]
MNELIDFLKRKQLVWHANDVHQPKRDILSTGYALLDEKLNGGFPASGVIELLSAIAIGELRLLMPLIADNQSKQCLMLINPPGLINASAWQYAGIDQHRILCVYPQSTQQALWTAEQSLLSGCCSDVLLWCNKAIQVRHIKRLQLAAQEGGSRQFLIRYQKPDDIGLPVDLSLSLEPHPQGVKVAINKRKKGWPVAPFILPLGRRWPWLVSIPESENITMFPNVRDVS